MRNLMVTGGAGFIGSNFVRYMLEKYPGYYIVVYDKLTYAGRLENLQDVAERFADRYGFVRGDICEAAMVQEMIHKHEIDTIVNFAAESVNSDTYIPVHLGHSIRLETIEELFERYARESGVQTDQNGIEIVSVKGVLRALSYRYGMGTWSQITHITRHWYQGEMVTLTQKWGRVTVTPHHSVYNIDAQLVSAASNPELLSIRKINLDRSRCKDHFVLRLRGCYPREEEGKIYHGVKRYSVPKQVWVLREYEGESLKALLRFLAAYIAEGNATFNKTNGAWLVCLANQDLSLLESWRRDVEAFSNANGVITQREHPNAHQLVFNSRLIYHLVTQLCGQYSGEKRVPSFVYMLQDEHKRVFLDTYLQGDGNVEKYLSVDARRFTTTSPRLAAGMGLLLSLMGLDYSLHVRDFEKEDWARAYTFRIVSSDDTRADCRMERFSYEGYVYDLTVERGHNFAAGIGNIVVHNTHVDRSIMDPDAFIKTDVYGTYVLLEAARELGLERYHQVSSVTGDTPLLVRDERSGETSLRPIASLADEPLDQFSVLTLTHDFEVDFRPMRHLISHNASELYEITFNGGGRVRATASHSVFVFEDGQIVAKPSSQLKEGDLMVTFVGDVRKDEKAPHLFDLRALFADYETEWMDESLMRRRRMLQALSAGKEPAMIAQEIGKPTFYRIAQELADGGYLERRSGIYAVTAQGIINAWESLDDIHWALTRRQLRIPAETLEVIPLLMEIFGLYLAAGHASHTPAELARNQRQVIFTIGKHETGYLNKLVRCAREVLHIEPSIKETEASLEIQYSAYWVHALFSQFGATAETKRLPPWIWTQPKEYVEAFFRGYEGDARIRKDGQRCYTTINRELAESLIWLARLNDINCRLSRRVTQQIAGPRPPNVTVTRQRVCWDIAVSAEHYHPDQRGRWRTPMARCLPTEYLIQALGLRQHHNVSLGSKQLVGKERAQAFLNTFEEVPAHVQALVNSHVGVAKIKSIRRITGNFTVYDVSVPGYERFFGGNVPCWLHNTDEVYGHVPEGASKETDPVAPRSPYAASKASADLLVNAYHVTYGLSVSITRGANNIGPFQYPEKVVPLFVTNAINDIPLPLYGDGLQVRDYHYVLDHCEAIDLVLHKGEIGGIYNVGTGTEMRNIDMARLILRLLGKPESLIQPVRDRPGHDRRYALDVSKIRALGWEPAHICEEAIEKTVRWYVENEWWWRPIKSGEHYREYYRRQYEGRELK